MRTFNFILLVTTLAASLIFSGCVQEQGKVFYVNSYHEGYSSSDDVMQGIKETLSGSGVELEIFFMDTKRNPGENYIKQKAQEAVDAILTYEPDVIIASDDNAVKYVVEPHFKNGPIPVVFCGVNWSASQYGLPTDNVTGMLEVLPVQQTVNALRNYYPDASTLTVLSENTTSERNNKEILDPVYQELCLTPTYSLVDNFSEWETAFRNANENSDLIFFVTNGAIQNWDDQTARDFIAEHIRVPVFTCDDFMMEFAVFGMTKIAQEQGEWAAETALEIIDGRDPGEIPLTKNSQVEMYLNETLADIIDFNPGADLREDAQIISW
ncbi:MAG: hypothetical protein GF372_02020 [Candidatus Marinimicrobia bacterium]|nr:hypothetical protein [Candidatus Neomarinimicrobiota bacterium]